jgi:ribosomal protein S18 acetylase RimI-like enzyme
MQKYYRLALYYLDRLGISFFFGGFYFYNLELPIAPHSNAKTTLEIHEIDKSNLRPEHIIGWVTIDQALQILSEPNTYFFVAFENNEIVGSCFLEIGDVNLDYIDCHNTTPEHSSYITHLIVQPNKRGHGIAYQLLNFAFAKSEEIGKTSIIISCAQKNTAVQNVFSKMNFNKYLSIRYLRFTLFRCYFITRINKENIKTNTIYLSNNIDVFKH